MAWMPFQANSCRERVWADPDMGAILTIKGLVRGGIFSSLFVAVDKKGLAHLLTNHYEVRTDLVCEIDFLYKKIYLINKLPIPINWLSFIQINQTQKSNAAQ